MWTSATFPFPPFTLPFSVYAAGLRISSLRRSWISSGEPPTLLALRFSPSLPSRLRYQVLSPSLRASAAFSRFVEIYSHPLAIPPFCFIPPRSTTALSFFLSVDASIASSRCLAIFLAVFLINNFAFQHALVIPHKRRKVDFSSRSNFILIIMWAACSFHHYDQSFFYSTQRSIHLI